MKAITNLTLAGLSLAAGVAGAVVAAPLFHHHQEPAGRLTAMWANDYATLSEMTNDADAVVLGRVTQTVPGRTVEFADGRPALPFTFVDVEVTQVLSGEAPAFVTIEQTGGSFLGKEIFFEDDGGAYQAGDEVLLFLQEQEGTGLYLVPHPAGRFSVESGRLLAALPDHPAAQALDYRSVKLARSLIGR